MSRTINKTNWRNRNVVTLVLVASFEEITLSIWCEPNKIKQTIELVSKVNPKMLLKLEKNFRNSLEI